LTGAEAPIRAFIALAISATAKSALADVMQRLAVQAPAGVRWVDPARMHLTLKFLGNVEPGLVDGIIDAIAGAAAGASPFSIHLSGLGMFPNERRPRILWAGVQGGLDALHQLREQIEESMSGLGFPRERRPFSPHLTLGRVREPVYSGSIRRISAAVTSISLEPTEPWPVDSVHLVRSTLTPGGARYSALASVPLGSAGGTDE
jgi:2'-5' RNA ligase